MNLNFMKLREQMENQKVSYYLVPSEDPHQSEYVDDYFKCRQYISGFTGSAGTFLAGCEEGWLWTDGRYFTQAEGQISSDITLMKQGVSGVPTILEFLKEHLQEGDTTWGKRLYDLSFLRKKNRKTSEAAWCIFSF